MLNPRRSSAPERCSWRPVLVLSLLLLLPTQNYGRRELSLDALPTHKRKALT